jgi:hypothetical protein
MNNTKSLFRDNRAKLVLAIFLFFILLRLVLSFFVSDSDPIAWNANWVSFWWGGLYQILAIAGGIFGLTIAKHWGGFKSLLGRSISAISIGLLLQAVGQSIATYYVYANAGGLYPSLADIGFFGSVLMYIYGGITLVSLAGGLKTAKKKWIIFIVPLVLLTASYFVFLQGYQFDFSNKLKIILDFGYPLGQALYVSMAITALILSRNVLGGIMRLPILVLLAAFIFQYFSDYLFLYQNSHGIYIAGDIVDIMYLISYFIMSMSLINFGVALNEIRKAQ